MQRPRALSLLATARHNLHWWIPPHRPSSHQNTSATILAAPSPHTAPAAVGVAALALAAAAASTTLHADSSPLLSPLSPPDTSLVSSASRGDISSLTTLITLSSSPDNHASLIASGAVAALAEALGSADVTLVLGILRALADLCRDDSAHAAFLSAAVPAALVRVFHEAGVADLSFIQSWLSWARSWGPGEKKAAESDSLLGDLDLRAGSVYHATRCVANLARSTATHAELLESDVLAPMVAILNSVPVRKLASAPLADVVGDEQQADTVRFAALSVAALAKTSAGTVVERRGHIALIGLLGQASDAVAQTYAAGGIRNLARHVEGDECRVHRELVVGGVAPALAAALTASSSPQTQIFAALALGDILTTKYRKADVIANRMVPAFEAFADLLASGNANVARVCHRVVGAVLASGGDETGMALSSEGVAKYGKLCEALAKQVAPLVRGAASRGDTAAMGAISGLCLDERSSGSIVVKGGVSLLVNALAAKNEYGQEAMIALARLSERPAYGTEISLRGGVKATMRRSSAGAEDCRWEAAALANMARSERDRPDIGHGGLPILMRAVNSKNALTRKEGARGLFNLSIGGVSRVLSAQGGALAPLMKIVDNDGGIARKYAVGAIAAISELFGFGAPIVELDGIAVLLRASEKDKSLSCDVARCLAQLSNHAESHIALAKAGAVEWLVNAVSSGDTAGEFLHHAAGALCNVAYTPGPPHEALQSAGASAALTGLANGLYAPYVCQCAKIALANLRQEVDPILQHADAFGQVDPA